VVPAMTRGERVIRASFRDGLQSRPGELVRREALARDQSPGDVVGALVRKEIADEVSATTRDDARPVLSILPESVALERVDLVPDETGHSHARSRCGVTTCGS